MMQKTEEIRDLELCSSAVSLSDMEIFIFPELMYSLVLANIMSPKIWQWKDDPWFSKIEKKSFTYKLNRVKQYIMDHYGFNLDLDTWGLTTKQREIDRFKDFIDLDTLKQSNALFGYEGDKYYFDINIRSHFDLDKYAPEVIPYWKTETVEAMDAFCYKEGYSVGAGECVSLSALYVAAMFVVGNIPLESMFLIATPLHSQNFMAEKTGILTNNRRIVTKSMWYNGTVLSAKARRAVEKEQITIVLHLSGYIHSIYPKATIPPAVYAEFKTKFTEFLNADLTFEFFGNFLFSKPEFWDCFQYQYRQNETSYYISMSTIFEAQSAGKHRFANDSQIALLEGMDMQNCSLTPLPEKALVNSIEEYIMSHKGAEFDTYRDCFLEVIGTENGLDAESLFEEFGKFLHTIPRLPIEEDKNFEQEPILSIATGSTRDEILAYIKEKANEGHPLGRLSLYAYRDMSWIDWRPFFKAALERNPVSAEGFTERSPKEVLDIINSWENISIYDSERFAQPDEVFNYKRGDGIEKAIMFVNYMKNCQGAKSFELQIKNGEVILILDDNAEQRYTFITDKNIDKNYKEVLEIV